ncbi:MAG: DegQ family serine endoprotease [Rhodanobacteraceae bacterium]
MTRMLLRWMAAPVLLIFFAASVGANDLPDFTGLVEHYGPAVVNVQAAGNPQTSVPGQPDIDQLPEIFRHFFGPMPQQPPGRRVSIGSGFIISSDGYILTNNHVVDDSDQVTVRLSDRRELVAKVVGSDPQYDIALLKVKASGLPTVSVGDSKTLKPGQWVVAIGSPFGFDHSVTAGIVSAIGRSFGAADQQYVPFIQTDVAINRGNSGGPLFNLAGQVVGINSQIFSNTGGFMGVSFAIPIDIAMNAVEQIKTTGHVSRGMIGVQIQNVDRGLAQSLGLPRTGGALVNKVTPGSGADKAGVRVGDVILTYNGTDVVSSADLPPLVGVTKPGSKADLGIFRDGKKMDLQVVVGTLPNQPEQTASVSGGGHAGPTNRLGIVVEDLTSEQRTQLNLKKEGVLVTAVNGVAAQRAALRPGDVILMVGRKPVASSNDFDSAVKNVEPGQSVMLLVRRDDVTSFIAISVPEKKGKGR